MFIPGALVFTIGVMIISFGIGRAFQHRFQENGGLWELCIGTILAIAAAFMKW